MTNRAEELITQLEAEIVKRDARIAELEAPMLAWSELDYTKHTRRSLMCYIGQQNFRITAQEKQLAALKARPSGVVDSDEVMQMAFEIGEPADDGSGYWFDLESFDEFIAAYTARLNPCRAQAVVCAACEGHPAVENNPCAVCGGAQAVPDGYVLVPVDPTPEMLDRYPFNVSAVTSEPMDKEDLRVVYQAMLAAAPSAKKES